MRLKTKRTGQRDVIRSAGFFVSAITYRVSLPVRKVVLYPIDGYCCPICPRCEQSIEREYMSFCDRCGQKLNWDHFSEARRYTAPIIK